MSVKSIAKENYFFNELPDDLIPGVAQFLDDKTLVSTTRVCRNWRDNPELNKERTIVQKKQDLLLEVEGYPARLIKLFRNCNFPIRQLPVLRLDNDPRADRDYIDFLTPADVSHPVMRIKTPDGRPGFALTLHGIAESTRNLTGILAVFKRNRVRKYNFDPGSQLWVTGEKESIERCYRIWHSQNAHRREDGDCPSCPYIGVSIKDKVISNLLKGEDPIFSLKPPSNKSYGRTAIAAALAIGVIAYLASYYWSNTETQ